MPRAEISAQLAECADAPTKSVSWSRAALSDLTALPAGTTRPRPGLPPEAAAVARPDQLAGVSPRGSTARDQPATSWAGLKPTEKGSDTSKCASPTVRTASS